MVSKKINGVTKKTKFDTSAFVFNTDINKVAEAIENFDKRVITETSQPFTDQELYWYGWWCLNLPFYRKYHQKTALLSAIESRILGVYTGAKKAKRKKS